jgi:chemotaxis protein MotB
MAVDRGKNLGKLGSTRRVSFPSAGNSGVGHKGGRWKLVYADFITVLMAFFIVTWILTYDKLSQEKFELDRSCTNEIANLVRNKLTSNVEFAAGKLPIEVANDFLVPGVRFTLVDSVQPMFESGSSRLSGFAAPQLDTIADAVGRCPKDHKLRIEGYTDATPYAGGDLAYSNWELSAERANTARRELLRRGVQIEQIAEVTGYGDSRPALPEDPRNPLNRRISITLLAPVRLINPGI